LETGVGVERVAQRNNYACDHGEWSSDYGGTSFAAPRWAGFLALVNQQAVANSNATLGSSILQSTPSATVPITITSSMTSPAETTTTARGSRPTPLLAMTG
jgi:subtilase family serine protease